MRLAILKNDFDDNHLYWSNACKSKNISFEIIDSLYSTWLDRIISGHFDGVLTCPPGRELLYKIMYDEKVSILENVLGLFVYPSYNEIILHENKKYLSYWLDANQLPHPKTNVFYSKNEAIDFAEKCLLPIVSKISIGASGKGVEIFSNRNKLKDYINKCFEKGVIQEWGPNLRMGKIPERILNVLKNPSLVKKKIEIYKKQFDEKQKGFIILQDYIEHDFEWRVVKIGQSFFGHQKVKIGDKASGSKGINYIAPPSELLYFVEGVCEKFSFHSMAVDLFEDGKGGYLINEMQCIFGHVQKYICELDGIPGRYIRKGNNWQFESGLFNSNLSYDLRLENVIQLLTTKLK